MNYFLLGIILGFIIGVFLGAFVVYQFNPKDTVINGKIKAKKGGKIDLKNIFKRKK
jgi:uncharacterized protein YneF (UPF0154 family)